ncbi:MAG TPA: hypothetical protein VFH64_10590 [Amnibacterium sp.]|nr:hypothetical protein [Amnibacterium sp.]
MSGLKRISMAGADIAVTRADVADLVLEYAKYLGRVGTTDTVTVPVARNGRVEHADLLIGPASQIALTENDDEELERIRLDVGDVALDLRRRIDSVTGRGSFASAPHDDDQATLVNFDAYDD